MGYYLESIHMHNFKLFTDKTITFVDNLNILDGANGYGKTSSFDAIEYALTGSVERVVDKSNVNANYAYDNDCLIKFPSDGTQTYVVAILVNKETKERIEITRKLVQGIGQGNNPTQIKARTKTTVKVNDTILVEGVTVEEANIEILKTLGEDLAQIYKQYYYVPQEDRMSFLSKKDTERMLVIQKLFNMQNEQEQLKKVQELKKQFGELKNEIGKKIKNIEELIKGQNKEEETKRPDQILSYKRLLINNTHKIIWDDEEIHIKDRNKLSELESEIRGTGSLSNNFEEYQLDQKNKWIKEIKDDEDIIQKYLFLCSYEDDVEEFKKEKDKYNRVRQMLIYQKDDNNKLEFTKINYEQLAKELNIKVNIEEINDIKSKIQDFSQRMREDDEAKKHLIDLQEKMKLSRESWIDKSIEGIEKNECPLCGHPWASSEELEENIDKIHIALENSQGQNEKLLNQEIHNIEEIYNNMLKQKIEQFLDKYKYLSSTMCEGLIKEWDVEKPKFNLFVKQCEKYNINLQSYKLDKEKVEEWLIKTQKFINEVLLSAINVLSPQYIEQCVRYNYDYIFKNVYENKVESVKKLEDNNITEKIAYIKQQYYLAQNAERVQLIQSKEKYKEQEVKVKKIHNDISQVESILKQELKDHKVDIVNRIQVPFYLYTGRILQNYPGGLGIIMKNENDKIRFEAINRPGHDVFYTLSSGQLSSIVIALIATLNKIYSGDSLKCILIDDPIQTMDELNIASFVELLRNDFSDYQLIFSTHEEDFSDYIRYKYDKYALSNKSISMQKDMEQIKRTN